MLRKLLRLLLVASWIIAFLLAYQSVEAGSATSPLAARAHIQVTRWAGDASVDELRRDLGELAREKGILIGQVVPSLEHNRTGRTIYLTGAGADEFVASGPAMDFGYAMRTELKPMPEIGMRGPVGWWIVLGEAGGGAVADALREHGAETHQLEPAGYPDIRKLASGSSEVIWVTALLLAGATAASVVSRTRRYAIRRLHGGEVWASWLSEIGPLFLGWLLGGAVTMAVGVGWAAISFGGVGVGELAAQTVLMAALLFSGALVSLLFFLWITHGTDILGAIKGEIPGRPVLAVAYFLRCVSVALALGLVAGVVALSADARSREEAIRPLLELGDASVVVSGNVYNSEDENRLVEVIRSWLASKDRAGDLLLAKRQALAEIPDDGMSVESLWVNHRYLEEQRVTLADGTRATAGSLGDGITILIGPGLWDLRDRVRKQAEVLFEGMIRQDAGDLPVQVAPVEAGQVLNTFSMPPEVAGESLTTTSSSLLSDPVVVVVPPGVFGPYAGTAGDGQLLVFGTDGIRADVMNNPELGRFVLSVTPVVERAGTIMADKRNELRIAAFGAATAGVVAVLAGVAVAGAYTRLHASRILVRHLHGWSMWSNYRVLIALEGIILLAVLAWAPYEAMRRRAEFEALFAGDPTQQAPALQALDMLPALLVSLVATGGFALTLLIAHRNIVRNGISEA